MKVINYSLSNVFDVSWIEVISERTRYCQAHRFINFRLDLSVPFLSFFKI